jgi:hypothetical protein
MLRPIDLPALTEVQRDMVTCLTASDALMRREQSGTIVVLEMKCAGCKVAIVSDGVASVEIAMTKDGAFCPKCKPGEIQ